MKRAFCPRDAALLVPRQHLGQPWFSCNRCRGMFLPLSMAPELVPLLDEVLMRAEQWPRSNLGCPQCGRSMHVAHHQGIEIDLCRHCHAVWLDKGEMDKIALQRARQEAKEEAQAEVTAQAPDVFSGVDWGSVDLGGALDWLGEALGGLLSP